jgi:threonine dehydratase
MNLNGTITPLESHDDLAKEIGLTKLYFKREDLHPLGSHKGRSISYMIDHYVKQGDKNFVISSSGNAALAAAKYVIGLNDDITLDIFVGNRINQDKLSKLKELENDKIRVLIKERPLQALAVAVEEGRRSLRQSTDDIALIGYKSLADEIMQVNDVGAVFIATSSATTAQALAQNFIKNKRKIQVHIVQTSSCHPISEFFDLYSGKEEISEADAIVDITAHRKDPVTKLINDTGGFGWIANNDDIHTAMNMTMNIAGIQISPNSALSVVGAMKASYEGYEINGSVICIISGK